MGKKRSDRFADEMDLSREDALVQATEPDSDLLFCAHCGGEAEYTSPDLSPRPASMPHQARCSVCHCCTPWCSLREAATFLWNRRAERKPPPRADSPKRVGRRRQS